MNAWYGLAPPSFYWLWTWVRPRTSSSDSSRCFRSWQFDCSPAESNERWWDRFGLSTFTLVAVFSYDTDIVTKVVAATANRRVVWGQWSALWREKFIDIEAFRWIPKNADHLPNSSWLASPFRFVTVSESCIELGDWCLGQLTWMSSSEHHDETSEANHRKRVHVGWIAHVILW